MRALAISVAIFINLIFFGMCGYMYLLWSQYWAYLGRQTGSPTMTYDEQIYFYNRGHLPNDTKTQNTTSVKLRKKHSFKDAATLVKHGKPRFPYLQQEEFLLDTKNYRCLKSSSVSDCDRKTSEYKDKILKELRKVFTDESNVLKGGLENPYNVQYDGVRGNFMNKSSKELICELKRAGLDTLKRNQIHPLNPLKSYIPKRSLFENKRFNSCAVVTSAGALKNSNLGKFIDSHNLVLRFNHAPTKGFEDDVGRKTTMRVVNSQVATKPEFNFLKSNLYRNITIVAWDPSNYSSTIDEWLKKPDFNLFPNYMEYRKREPKSRFFILNSQTIWDVWDYLQSNSPSRLRRNPPSSGFLGLGILLPFCNFVDIFEYVPSSRVTKRCHYYDPEENPACTFGVWHPLAAEKLLTYHMNSADDDKVFQKGFVRIQGFRNLNC